MEKTELKKLVSAIGPFTNLAQFTILNAAKDDSIVAKDCTGGVFSIKKSWIDTNFFIEDERGKEAIVFAIVNRLAEMKLTIHRTEKEGRYFKVRPVKDDPYRVNVSIPVSGKKWLELVMREGNLFLIKYRENSYYLITQEEQDKINKSLKKDQFATSQYTLIEFLVERTQLDDDHARGVIPTAYDESINKGGK